MASHLGNSWDSLLKAQFDSDYFDTLRAFLNEEYSSRVIYPPKRDILSAFAHTPFENVKVVIIGQDPYIGEGQANGMCFSVGEGVKCPPSLVNIYKALEYDMGIPPTDNGDLRGWAKQGVLLLNAVLTVRAGQSGSHAGKGWERFTDYVIRIINDSDTPTVFMLWGGYAKAKGKLVTNPRHLVLTSVHPSPLSFYQGFLECRHFSKANGFLIDNGRTPVDWSKRALSD